MKKKNPSWDRAAWQSDYPAVQRGRSIPGEGFYPRYFSKSEVRVP